MTPEGAPPPASDTPKPSPARAAPTLIDAIRHTFSVDVHTPAFHDRVAKFAAALTTAPWVCVQARNSAGDVITISGACPDAVQQEVGQAAGTVLATDENVPPDFTVERANGCLVARIALPAGALAALAIGLPKGGQVAQSLAYERLALLAALSFAHNRSADQTRQDQLVTDVQAIAAGDAKDMTPFLDRLAQHTGADYAVAGRYAGGIVKDLTISGQQNLGKRAALPDRLRPALKDTARQRLRTAERCFAATPSGDRGLILHLENPRRNRATLTLLSAVYGLTQHSTTSGWFNVARLTRIAAVALALVGVALIPVPDGVELPAQVQAVERRAVTAPFTAILSEVLVEDNAQVAADETVLAQLDTQDLDLELIGVRAEHATALLQREAARAGRNAAELRNAELEVERLTARIAVLENRRASAGLLAPISGVVLAPDLAERVGTTIRQGDLLLEVADPAQLRLSLAIPEAQIGKLTNGATGTFRPDFDPAIRIAAHVSLISPALLPEADDTVFVGRAEFDDAPDGVRAGLRGILVIDREFRALGAVVYTSLRDWLLLRFWL